MSTIRHIRTAVFKLNQAEFAALAGVGQGSVSRWENGTPLSSQEMQAIREAAIARGITWDDKLFFEIPPTEEAEQPAGETA